MSELKSNRSSLGAYILPPESPLHSAMKPEQESWKAPSLAATHIAVPKLIGVHLEDANTLLALLCFLAPSESTHLDLLFRGATPRKRWNTRGEIEEIDTTRVGLAPELCHLLLDLPRLSRASHELELLSAISKTSDQSYTVDEAITSRVYGNLSPELRFFWQSQALVISYRPIPWKCIEPS